MLNIYNLISRRNNTGMLIFPYIDLQYMILVCFFPHNGDKRIVLLIK